MIAGFRISQSKARAYERILKPNGWLSGDVDMAHVNAITITLSTAEPDLNFFAYSHLAKKGRGAGGRVEAPQRKRCGHQDFRQAHEPAIGKTQSLRSCNAKHSAFPARLELAASAKARPQ